MGERPTAGEAHTGLVPAYAGVSMYASLAQLREKARAFPMIGAYAAELEVPDDVTHDGPGPDGHVRLVGQTTALIIRHLVAVHPMEPGRVRPMRE
jgi:hypothetical protein